MNKPNTRLDPALVENARAAVLAHRKSQEEARVAKFEADQARRKLVMLAKDFRAHIERFKQVAPDHPFIKESEAYLVALEERLRIPASRRIPYLKTTPQPVDADGSIVYFVQAASGGPIKIGTTGGLSQRLHAMQSGSPVQLVVIATTPGGQIRERSLHSRLKEHRLHGEWFADCEEVQRVIAEVRS